MSGEFDLIARCFAPLAGPEGLDLKDDAALFRPPEGEDIVITADANVAGVHFLEGEQADVIARRLLRTNLSDIAAKGARPLGYLLTLALPPSIDVAWLDRFAAGLAADQARYGVRLFGGDTVSTAGPVVASITALGAVASGRMIRRAGAAPGDAVFVTGTIGDAGLGLAVAEGRAAAGLTPAERQFLETRFKLPEPPVGFGAALGAAGLASAAADVSDGLVADAGHIAVASGVRIEIESAAAPCSPAALASGVDRAVLLTSGDDYEIVFTAHPGHAEALAELGALHGVRVTRIGAVSSCAGGQPSAVLLDSAGAETVLEKAGYTHR